MYRCTYDQIVRSEWDPAKAKAVYSWTEAGVRLISARSSYHDSSPSRLHDFRAGILREHSSPGSSRRASGIRYQEEEGDSSKLNGGESVSVVAGVAAVQRDTVRRVLFCLRILYREFVIRSGASRSGGTTGRCEALSDHAFLRIRLVGGQWRLHRQMFEQRCPA